MTNITLRTQKKLFTDPHAFVLNHVVVVVPTKSHEFIGLKKELEKMNIKHTKKGIANASF